MLANMDLIIVVLFVFDKNDFYFEKLVKSSYSSMLFRPIRLKFLERFVAAICSKSVFLSKAAIWKGLREKGCADSPKVHRNDKTQRDIKAPFLSLLFPIPTTFSPFCVLQIEKLTHIFKFQTQRGDTQACTKICIIGGVHERLQIGEVSACMCWLILLLGRH